jgi:CBS domain-containing protein
MYARDVMTSPVITATPDSTLLDIAQLMLEHNISGVPIVDKAQHLVGLVSEGDLVRRKEVGIKQKKSWWLSMFGNATVLADEFVRSHGVIAEEVMTKTVTTAAEDTPLWKIAETLEKEKIKRVPVLRDGRVIGIVSRANLLQALTLQRKQLLDHPSREDSAIREELLQVLKDESWADLSHVNVMVTGGSVHLWGSVRSEAQREALSVAAKGIPGVRDVVNHAHLSLTLL